MPAALQTPPARGQTALTILRVTLAVLIGIHGWARLVAGGVVPFGEWLASQGFPFGFGIASAITAVEILGTPLLAFGRLVQPLAILYSGILLVGIVMVHASSGWFVVGLGRNGVEYSVLLIVCLLCV